MVILIGELMKQAERYITDGLHPRIIAEVGWVGRRAAHACSFVPASAKMRRRVDACAAAHVLLPPLPLLMLHAVVAAAA